MVRSSVTAENINAYACYDSQGNKITDDSFINQLVKITENYIIAGIQPLIRKSIIGTNVPLLQGTKTKLTIM